MDILKTGFRCYDNEGISCLKGILSTRNDDLSLSVNRCYQKVWPCFHILQTDADHTAILVNDKLKRLHTVFHQLIQRLNVASDGVFHCPDILQNVLCGDVFRVDQAVQVQALDNFIKFQ